MFGPKRDALWAWIALAIALVASLAAAPWDADVRRVAIDGTIGADGVVAEGPSDGGSTEATDGNAVLAGGTTGGDTSDGTSDGGSSTGLAVGATTSGSTSGGSTSGGSTSGGSTSGGSTSGGATAGTTSGGSTTSGGTTSGGTTGGNTSGGTSGGSTTVGTTGGSTGGSTGGTVKGKNGKGVTDTEVRIGFYDLVGQSDAAGQLGFAEALPNPGNTKAQIAAMADWANKNGGIAGREVKPIIKEIRFAESSDSGEESICTSLREDEGVDVFAAILIGTIREATRSCLAEGGIITLDPSAFPMTGYLYEQTVIDGVAYLWSPSYPTLNDTSAVLAQHLSQMDFFKAGIHDTDPCVVAPCPLGVLMYDFPNYNRLVDEVIKPAFAAVGNPVASVQKVDSRDAASIEAGLSNAVLGFQRDGVNRVIFVGGSPLAPFFMVTAASAGYRPVYGVTSFDQPRFATDNGNSAPNQAHGMRGIGFAPAIDVHDDKYTKVAAMEKRCTDIYAEYGIEFVNRGAARVAMAYCESTIMLKHVAERTAPDLTAKTWAAEAGKLGDSFQTVDGFRTHFSPAKRAGSDAFQRFAVAPDCYCTNYISNLYPFSRA